MPDTAPGTAPRDHDDLRERMSPELPKRLRKHTARVVELAAVLAQRFHADEPRVLLAAQGHDLLRGLEPEELLRRAEARNMTILREERDGPILLHGPLGALELQERFGVDDPVVLDTIRWHTTGHPSFGTDAWCVFIADKVEPKKRRKRPELDRVADLAEHSLVEAALSFLELRVEWARDAGTTEHPRALETAEALREQLRSV